MSKDPYVYEKTNILENIVNVKEQNRVDDIVETYKVLFKIYMNGG